MDGIKIISAENEKVLNGLQKWNTLALAKIDALERQDLIFLLIYSLYNIGFHMQKFVPGITDLKRLLVSKKIELEI